MRGDKPRSPRHVARFVFELIGEPVSAVVAALNDDFIPNGGHDPEQAVRVERAEGTQPRVYSQNARRSQEVVTDYDRDLDGGDGQDEARERNGNEPWPLEF